jgi:dTDP-4-amino-4,6-dideoxygalactose transaminase
MTTQSISFVDLHRQYEAINTEVDAAIQGVLKRADFILGSEVAAFEEDFASFCEAAYAVGVDSGASALELGLRAIEIQAGDEVLVPANSFIASASAVSATGAIPVFVDIDPSTYNIDIQQITRHITPRTRAIIPVHLYGQPADMDAILQLAEQYGLFVIEDACQAHGARYRGHRVGSIGHIGAFSFYPGKNLGAYGDGGALITNDPQIADRVRILRNCGQREKYQHILLGGNHRLDTIQAAVLRVKLQYLDGWNRLRQRNAALYTQLLAELDIVTPGASPVSDHVYHLYVVQAEQRDRLQHFLTVSGIATGIHYPVPIHLQPAYASLGYQPGDYPATEFVAPRLLSLPMFAELRSDEIQFVAERVHSFMHGEARVLHQQRVVGG